MNQFSAAIGGALNRGLAGRALIGATLAAATLSFAAPADASVRLHTATPQDIYQIGGTEEVIPGRPYFGMSPYIISATDNGRNFSALAFCVQFYVDMPEHLNAAMTVNTVNGDYHEGDFLTLDGADVDVQTQVFNLIGIGSDLWLQHSAPDLNTRLAAIQGAIWQVMTNKTFGFLDYGYSTPDNNYLIQDYIDLSTVPRAVPVDVRVLLSDNGTMQGVAYSLSTVVPEPGTWALMLVGFFSVGTCLRASRRRLAVRA